MTCKDCMHYDRCKNILGIWFPDQICKDFADKSQYIKLPCKVGDTVYTNIAIQGSYLRKKDRPYACKVVFVGLNGSEEYGGGFINIVYSQREAYMWKFDFSDIGKEVFLTKEAAEKALRECEDE